jgi:hypothetical protein
MGKGRSGVREEERESCSFKRKVSLLPHRSFQSSDASENWVRKFASENELHCVAALLYSFFFVDAPFAAALCCCILSKIYFNIFV